MKLNKSVLLWPVLSVLSACSLAMAGELLLDASSRTDEVCELHFSNGTVLEQVPVAKTARQQARGLSKRYDAGSGMLFSWKEAHPRSFWMRDTYIPLSVGFFDEKGQLFSIQDMGPETDDAHLSIEPALDALELAQGQFQQHGLVEGVRMIKRFCANGYLN